MVMDRDTRPMTGRPKTLTPELALNAARPIIAQMFQYGHFEADDDQEARAQELAKNGRTWMDGYELAQEMDRRCYWDCDFEMAEQLDGFAYAAQQEIDAAQKQWAEENNIQPPYPNGTRVRTQKGDTGIIDRVYEYGAAKYCIKVDGDPAADGPSKARLIVNFEDVEPI